MLRNLKEEKTKLKISTINEIIKIKVDVNETGNTKTTEKSVKPKVGFLKKGNERGDLRERIDKVLID